MAKNYAGENTLKALTQLVKTEFGKKADLTKVASDIADAISASETSITTAYTSAIDAAKQSLTSDLGNKIDTAKSELDSKITDLTSTVTNNKSEIDQKISTIEGNVSTNASDIADIKRVLGESDDESESLIGRVGTLESEVDELQTDVSGLKTDVGDLKAKDSALEAKDTELKNEIDGINTRLGTAETTISSLDITEGKVAKAAQADNATNATNAENASKLGGKSVTDFVLAEKVGQANGVVPLNGSTQIDSTYLPSYVDDVLDGKVDTTQNKFYKAKENESGYEDTETAGEKGKIYVDIETNTSYRWSGSTFVKIVSDDLIEISNATVQDIWDDIMLGGIVETKTTDIGYKGPGMSNYTVEIPFKEGYTKALITLPNIPDSYTGYKPVTYDLITPENDIMTKITATNNGTLYVILTSSGCIAFNISGPGINGLTYSIRWYN